MNEACAVCGRSATKEYAIVAAGERLCIGTIDSCFGWFSGYPWVLFEEGFLVSNIGAEKIRMGPLPPEFDSCLLCYNLMRTRCECASESRP